MAGVARERRSPTAEQFEKEVRRAKIAIVEDEIREQGGRKGAKDATLLSRAVGRAEERGVSRMRGRLAEAGWPTGTLIHDAVVVGKDGREREFLRLSEEVERALAAAEEERGWGQYQNRGEWEQYKKFRIVELYWGN